MYEKLPQKLKDTDLFCAYRNEQRGGKKTKVPYNMRTLCRAQSNNKESFCDFATALRHVSKYDGLGVGVFDGLCAIDIDHCVKPDKTLTALAADVAEIMDSYTEYSPSGTGLRILFTAEGFEYDKTRYYINNQKLGLEIYVSGATHKFLTVTGSALRERGLEDRSQQLLTVLEKYMERPNAKVAKKPNT